MSEAKAWEVSGDPGKSQGWKGAERLHERRTRLAFRSHLSRELELWVPQPSPCVVTGGASAPWP